MDELETLIGYTFKNKSHLETALTHSSMRSQDHYERYEFLGDAVIDLVVAKLLIDAHPNSPEGELSKMRATLVSSNGLSQAGRELGLERFIRAKQGMNQNLVADVVEALCGAVFLDSTFEEAFKFGELLFKDRVKTVSPRDPKTELQELLHQLNKEPPVYELESTEGPDHAPTFSSVVKIEGQVLGRGQGESKKLSQARAAEEALEKLKEVV